MKLQFDFHHGLLLFGYSLWEYWLGKTKRFVANSTWELILHGVRRLLRRKTK